MRLLREPLVHFLVAGALLFAAEAAMRTEEPDKRAIVVTDELRSEIADTVSRRLGRPATEAELAAAVDGWVDDEVLFREALNLGLDQDDPRIRDHLVQKMRYAIASTTDVVSAPEEAELRDFFAAHEEAFLRAPRYSFTQIPAAGEDEARELADALNAEADPEALGPARRFERRSPRNVENIFGTDFASAVGDAQPGEWLALGSERGWQTVRIDSVTAPPATFEELRPQILDRWAAAERSRAAKDAIDALRAAYTTEGGS